MLIAEGYATAASVHEAMGRPVVVAFDAHNLNIAAQLVETIHDPETYRIIDRGFSRDKNRLNGLPRDEARQFFLKAGKREKDNLFP